MANFSTLIAEIEAYIKTNGEQEITGQILQNVLKDIVDTLGNGAVFKGIATTDGTPGTPDNNVFYFAALAGTYTNYGGAVLDGNTLHILGYNGSWTDVDTGVPSATAAATFAKIDGYYASLTAGAAENLVGRGSVPATFLRRTTGGTADVGTGSAKIAKLMGNSIVWNQLVENTGSTITDHEVTFTKLSNGQWSISGTATGGAASVQVGSMLRITGHKYLIRLSGNSVNVYANVSGYSGYSATPKTNSAIIVTAQNQATSTFTLVVDEGQEASGTAIMSVFDLTKMFGAGKEPTTIVEFEALFPLPYYAYEPGKVLPFAAEKLVTTGFNQWDEEWEVGAYNDSTGAKVISSQNIRSKNAINVFPGTTYCFTGGLFRVIFYDASDAFISKENVASGGTTTTPANARFARFYMSSNYGTTYKNDICINLSWSGYRNGEYEPYELHELVMDPANWEDANGNKIFPYGGMHGVGTARDFATPDTDGFIRMGTRVFGRIDMGSLTWEFPANSFFQSNAISDFNPASDNYLCYKYDTGGYMESPTIEKILYRGGGRLKVKDSAYSDAAAFKAAMSGVYLYYELATPVETELAEPVAASYYANDFGTEEWQPANTDEPYTAPCELAIAYAMNAVDTLRRLPENYISTGSFENFCTELASKLGAALNKSITIAATYDAEDEEYDYAITIEDIEEG